MTVENHIYDLLATDDTVGALVGAEAAVPGPGRDQAKARVYYVQLPQHNVGPNYWPALLITKVSGYRDQHLRGPSGWANPRFQIDCFAQTYMAAKELADAVRELMDGYVGTRKGTLIRDCSLSNERDNYEEDVKLYTVSLDFQIWNTESNPNAG
ncbi:MAG: DUF3168 domain-containing protein [Bdellovibrionales bacterium]